MASMLLATYLDSQEWGIQRLDSMPLSISRFWAPAPISTCRRVFDIVVSLGGDSTILPLR